MGARGMRSSVVLSVALVGLVAAPRGWPCSEGEPESLWFFTMHPDLPLPPYASGRLGILQPSLAPSYLVVAYLYLQGRTLTRSEQESVLDLWSRRLGRQLARGGEQGEDEWPLALKDWQDARDEVLAPALRQPIDGWGNGPEYVTYLNCPAAAFRAAAATLRERAREYSPGNPRVAAWLAAQDQVFANCREAGTRVIPDPPGPEDDQLARADRDYQIAAALFYAGDYAAAADAFQRIELDATSPWRKWARYLAARALVRQATLSATPPVRDLLARARADLDELLKSGPPTDVLRASRSLRDLVSFRLDPLEHAHDLAARMAEPEERDTLGHRIDDFTLALLAVRQSPTMRMPGAEIDWSAGGRDDLTHWVTTFHIADQWQSTDDRLPVALERWRATHSLPWLVAALSFIGPGRPEVAALLEAARAVPLDSPGGTTVAYHRLRLMIAGRERAEARTLLDRLLREDVGERGPSARNLFLDQRLQVATDLEDLRAHLPRRIVGSGLSYGAEWPSTEGGEGGPATSPLGARLLNGLPLPDLTRLALELDDGASGLGHEVARAAWVKALVLEDPATLTALEQRYPDLAGGSGAGPPRTLTRLIHWIEQIHPPWVVPDGPLQPPERWEPGVSPSAVTGWWCDATSSYGRESPPFLDAKAAERAEAEWAVVLAAGSGPEFAARRAARYARETPDAAGVPQALHLAIASTRWACSRGGVGDASREAYRLLHRQYADSSWAKKTTYWYAGRW